MSTVRRDFFLDPAQRLTEQERALMSAMLHCLAGDIADEIRAELPARDAANDGSNSAVVSRLIAAGLLDEPGLMALLLRRADEEQISAAAQTRTGRGQPRVLQGLISEQDPAISAAAMTVVLARGRRRDRFGQCLVHFDDLPHRTAERIAAAIAAALAAEGPGVAHADLADAAQRVSSRIDPSKSLDSLLRALVVLLDDAGRLDDALIAAAAEEGEIAFVAEALALRAKIAPASAFDELMAGNERRFTMLLRMGHCSRELAALMLAGAGDILGIEDPGAAIGLFDRIDEKTASAARAELRLPPEYLAARSALEALDG